MDWGLPCGRPALSALRTGPVVPAHSGDDQEQFGLSGNVKAALFPALRAPEGAAFFALTRWHSCLSPCRMGAGAQLRARTIRLRRALQGCRRCAARRLGKADRLLFLIGGNAEDFTLSFPKAESPSPSGERYALA